MKKILFSLILLAFFSLGFSQKSKVVETKLYLWTSPDDSPELKEFSQKEIAVFERDNDRKHSSERANILDDVSKEGPALVITMYTNTGLPVYVMVDYDQYQQILKKFPDQKSMGSSIKGIYYHALIIKRKRDADLTVQQRNLIAGYSEKVRYVLSFKNSGTICGVFHEGKILPEFGNPK